MKKNVTRLKTLINTPSVNSFRKGCEYHSLVNSFTHTQGKTGNNNKEEGKLSKTTLLLVTRMQHKRIARLRGSWDLSYLNEFP